MGSDHSKSVQTYVQTETNFFYPGCTVIGIVNINALSTIPANQMLVRLTCSEIAYITEDDSEIYSERETSVLHYPIWHFNRILSEGQYSIPFSLQLPTDLSPSYDNINESYTAVIRYSLDAFVENSSEVYSFKSIIWLNNLGDYTVDIPPAVGQRTFYFRNLCCTSGISIAYTEVNHSTSIMDQDLLISVRVDNKQNQYNIQRIKCSLIRFTALRARTICGKSRKMFQDKICSTSQIVNIPSGGAEFTERFTSIDFTLKPRSRLLLSTSTVRGKLVECEYNIKVQVYYDILCAPSTYGMYVPIELLNGTIHNNKRYSKPPTIPDN